MRACVFVFVCVCACARAPACVHVPACVFLCVPVCVHVLACVSSTAVLRGALHMAAGPGGSGRCQPRGYLAPPPLIVCNYPANLFTSARRRLAVASQQLSKMEGKAEEGVRGE